MLMSLPNLCRLVIFSMCFMPVLFFSLYILTTVTCAQAEVKKCLVVEWKEAQVQLTQDAYCLVL